jgi:nucleoside-diphosphate-sugar epimerase
MTERCRTAVVTGAAGFVGQNLVDELVERGWSVVALNLPGADVHRVARDRVRFVDADITDYDQLAAAMPDAPDAVFHVAANTSSWSKHDDRQAIDNVLGTANVVRAALARRARRLIYTSSISAYGSHPGEYIDEQTPSNALTCGNNYGRTKYEAELIVKQAVRTHGLDAVILNPVNILGPHDTNNWTKELIRPVIRGTLRAAPPGRAMFCHVKDIVDAHISAVDRGAAGENYLLGGVEASFKQVVDEIRRVAGMPPSGRVLPKLALRVAMVASMVKTRLDHKPPLLTPERYARAVGAVVCNDAKAVRDLGYRRSSLRQMIEDTYRWLEREHLLDEPAPAASTVKRDPALGVEYVEVADEPHHIPQFENQFARVYTATIAPGGKTLYHRHCADTLYIAIRGGVVRTEIKGKQHQRIGFARSIGLATKLRWGLRRLVLGSVDVPTSTVYVQYNKQAPVVHRVVADPHNKEDVELMGIEVLRHSPEAGAPGPGDGRDLEYRDAEFEVRRLHVAPRQSTHAGPMASPALCVVTRGTARIDGSASLGVGGVEWIDAHRDLEIANPTAEALEALVVAIR